MTVCCAAASNRSLSHRPKRLGRLRRQQPVAATIRIAPAPGRIPNLLLGPTAMRSNAFRDLGHAMTMRRWGPMHRKETTHLAGCWQAPPGKGPTFRRSLPSTAPLSPQMHGEDFHFPTEWSAGARDASGIPSLPAMREIAAGVPDPNPQRECHRDFEPPDRDDRPKRVMSPFPLRDHPDACKSEGHDL